MSEPAVAAMAADDQPKSERERARLHAQQSLEAQRLRDELTELRPGMLVEHRTGGPTMLIVDADLSAQYWRLRLHLLEPSETREYAEAGLFSVEVSCRFWKNEEDHRAFETMSFRAHELVVSNQNDHKAEPDHPANPLVWWWPPR